ncbi:Hypothetical predicted protein [Lecanosticta acicola]|uniref:Uncharacterized protein n=1 Tax=Lecanosticta acicola TaxID=111012 RepID=A0AAI8Z5H2_9PEZI|nr:Hypothetical predicted protein [Lecanosticta acicola]
MEAIRAQLAEARERAERAEDRVEAIKQDRDSLQQDLDETGEKYDILSERYHRRDGRVLEEDYLGFRSMYRRMQDERRGLTSELRRAEGRLDEALAEERAVEARLERARLRENERRVEEGSLGVVRRAPYRVQETKREAEGYLRPCGYFQDERVREGRLGRSYYYDGRESSASHDGEYRRSSNDHLQQDSKPRRDGKGYNSTQQPPRREQHPREDDQRKKSTPKTRQPEKGTPRNHRRSHPPHDKQRSSQEARPRAEERRQPRATGPSTRSPAHRPRPGDDVVAGWWEFANECFQDYEHMQQFPVPPACTACNGNCESSLQALLRRIPNLNPKLTRVRFHPDKFSACPADKRVDFKARAGEIFVVLNEMLRREEEEEGK